MDHGTHGTGTRSTLDGTHYAQALTQLAHHPQTDTPPTLTHHPILSLLFWSFTGKIDAPHKKQASDAIAAALKAAPSRKALLPDSYSGDTTWYSGFSSFFNTPRQ